MSILKIRDNISQTLAGTGLESWPLNPLKAKPDTAYLQVAFASLPEHRKHLKGVLKTFKKNQRGYAVQLNKDVITITKEL